MDDKQFVEWLRTGDEGAYKELYARFYAPLCEIAAQLVHDDFTAESIVGDIFFHIWKIRTTLNLRSSLRSYLLVSVRNRCLNHLASVWERNSSSLDGKALTEVERLMDADHPLNRLVSQELEEAVEKAVRELPETTRHVFLLHRDEGLKYEQIASALGISVNTVKYHMKRALAQLRDRLFTT